MSTVIDYKNLDISEKFIILEELWENMTHNAQKSDFTPKWHLDELKKREKNIQDNSSSFHDLNDAKSSLQKLL